MNVRQLIYDEVFAAYQANSAWQSGFVAGVIEAFIVGGMISEEDIGEIITEATNAAFEAGCGRTEAPMAKAPIENVVLDQVTGHRKGRQAITHTLVGAGRVFTQWALTAPADGNGDTVRVTVSWKDALCLVFYVNVERRNATEDVTYLMERLVEQAQYLAGIYRPPYMSARAHNIDLLKREKESGIPREEWDDILEHYAFDDG